MQVILQTILPLLFSLSQTAIETGLTFYSALQKHTDTLNEIHSSFVRRGREVQEYDFIVVGGGSAGAVVANRLSEHFQVVLLERGGEENPLQYIPALASQLLHHKDIDYGYKTVPQNSSCLSVKNQECVWNRGRGLGGSSNLNFMIYLRGHKRDYDNWANITGDARWNYKNIFPFFTKSEDYCIQCEKIKNDATFNARYHHKNGYQSLGKGSFTPFVEEFLQANEWAGIPRTDLNGEYTEGAAPIFLTHRNGRRCSTNTAFLDPIRSRPNLKIIKYAQAYKVLFRNPNNEAYGVEYEKNGKLKTMFARKEVILSAGSIDSAKILLLSGVGPKDHLDSLQIPVRKDLPVGENLQDHIGVFVGPILVNKTKSSLLFGRDATIKSVFEFILHGTGLLSQTGVHATSLHASSLAREAGEGSWSDTQYFIGGIGFDAFVGNTLSRIHNVESTVYEKLFEFTDSQDGFFMSVYNLRPKTKGTLTLRSTDHQDAPIIDPKYFQDPQGHDIKLIVEGVQRALYIFENSPSFARLGARLAPLNFEPCQMHRYKSDAYWECYIRHLTSTIWHFVGTCRMGKIEDPKAVVDSELHVLGTRNLRVIDNSIMPEIVSANTNGPAIMIGERGAQFIIDKYRYSHS